MSNIKISEQELVQLHGAQLLANKDGLLRKAKLHADISIRYASQFVTKPQSDGKTVTDLKSAEEFLKEVLKDTPEYFELEGFKSSVKVIEEYHTYAQQFKQADNSKEIEELRKENNELKDSLNSAKEEIYRLRENYVIVVDDNVRLRENIEEIQKDLDETFHKLEGFIEHNEQLKQQLSELQQRNGELEAFIKEIDKSLYLGEDLQDKDILDFYIGVVTTIKEEISTRFKSEQLTEKG
jgi:chromosome segregation ATPase